jgi:hypothetical protein
MFMYTHVFASFRRWHVVMFRDLLCYLSQSLLKLLCLCTCVIPSLTRCYVSGSALLFISIFIEVAMFMYLRHSAVDTLLCFGICSVIYLNLYGSCCVYVFASFRLDTLLCSLIQDLQRKVISICHRYHHNLNYGIMAKRMLVRSQA